MQVSHGGTAGAEKAGNSRSGRGPCDLEPICDLPCPLLGSQELSVFERTFRRFYKETFWRHDELSAFFPQPICNGLRSIAEETQESAENGRRDIGERYSCVKSGHFETPDGVCRKLLQKIAHRSCRPERPRWGADYQQIRFGYLLLFHVADFDRFDVFPRAPRALPIERAMLWVFP